MASIKELTYSELVVIRVSHVNPAITSNAASVLREELSRVVCTWLGAMDEQVRPKLEVLECGSIHDFLFREQRPC